MIEYEITTPVEGYTGEVAGVAFAQGRGKTSAPGAVAYFRRHGYGVEPVDEEEPAIPVERPTKSASKADWVAYAVAQGLSAEEAETATRDELAARYAEDGGNGASDQ